MTSPNTIVLIRRAKEGDREAWACLCERYYPEWCRRFHGKIGQGLRHLYETKDIINSALAVALKDIGDLRNEAAFFSWVSAIAQRKIAEKRRRENRKREVALEEQLEPGKKDSQIQTAFFRREDYLRLRDAMEGLFPKHPEPMAAVYLKYFLKADIPTLKSLFEMSDRSVYRLLEEGMKLLGGKLDK